MITTPSLTMEEIEQNQTAFHEGKVITFDPSFLLSSSIKEGFCVFTKNCENCDTPASQIPPTVQGGIGTTTITIAGLYKIHKDGDLISSGAASLGGENPQNLSPTLVNGLASREGENSVLSCRQ
jgi:hypothetical protein